MHTPTTFFSCEENDTSDCSNPGLNSEAESQCDNVIELSNGEIVSILEGCLTSCGKLSEAYRESIVKRIATLETALQTSSVSQDCRQKLNLLVNHLANQRYISAYELHSLLMLNYFSEVHSWMAGVKAIILECQKQRANCTA
uniref:SRA1 domain-containing protein n=1 Tax=Trichuris muris TaxID=70415 RepID=A0A5S6QJ38_TRIMR